MCDVTKGYRLYFVKALKFKGDKRKMPIYVVRKDDAHAAGARLGLIKFSGAWRQYVFHPDSGTFWNRDCLDKINGFLHEKNQEWREAHKRKP